MTTDYTVFVDESFFRWFGLPTHESNLCYGALSIPSHRLPALESFEARIQKHAFSLLPEQYRAGKKGTEFKYSDFRHLSHDSIKDLGHQFGNFLKRNDAFIFGYFVPAEGFLNYKLRSDFIDDLQGMKGLPESEYKERIGSIRQTMLQEWTDAEQNIGLLKECYSTFFWCLVQSHGGFLRKTFRIVYDSRNPIEDALLHEAAEKQAALLDRADPGVFAYYRGYSSESSQSSSGLKLVDWIAGEIRNFFYRNPAVLESDSSFDILSPYMNPTMISAGTTLPFYRKKLSPEAIECFSVSGRGFMLPHLRAYFGSGFLTHYARKGEARMIATIPLEIFDMAD